jgi:putative transposase
VNRLCQAAGVSRAGYYRFLLRGQIKETSMDLRSKIQSIALDWPAYGYRRVHRELIRCRLESKPQASSAADAGG